MNTSAVRVRFAPSPTGHLHVGSVRVAIFNWLYARHAGGTYLLRIEDTDIARSTKAFVDSQLRSLAWLGLMPDEAPVYQLDSLGWHREVAQRLVVEGMAYPCFCAPKSVDAREEHEADAEVVGQYPGTCRDKQFTAEDLRQPHAIRFRMPAGQSEVVFEDVIRGRIAFPADQLDDFIIIRRDGIPIYNFVVVVDDIAMKITHIIRGEDHISNTPKQVMLYKALGAIPPIFAHLPLILGPSGQRLSKREAAVSVEEYRAQGFLPDALFNYLVRLGWAYKDQEVFTKAELVELFTLEAINKKSAIFDIKKLEWLNGVYLREMSIAAIRAALAEVPGNSVAQIDRAWPAKQADALLEQYKSRSVTLVELATNVIAFATAPQVLDISLIKKWHKPYTKNLVEEFCRALEELDEFSHDSLFDAAQQICAQHGAKLVELAQPLRLALVGSVMSPGIFEMLEILGSEASSKRLAALIAVLE